MVDENFRVTLVNAKMCEISGYRAEELLGRPLHDFVDDDQKTQTEHYFERRREGLRDQVDVSFRRADGERVWLIISSNPIIGSGEFQGVLYLATDITERKKAGERSALQRAVSAR